MYAELITAALALTPTTLIPRQTRLNCPATISCPANNGCSSTAANGAAFQLKCTTNFNGPVIAVNQAATFAKCITACSVTSGCKGLNYKGEFCYLLGNTINVGPTVSVSNVNAATQTRPATIASPTAGSSICTTAITCPATDGCQYTSNSKTFYTRCGFDFYGGDMADGNSKVANMKRCVDKCATTKGCVGVSFSTSTKTCYLKSVLQPAVYSSNTNGM
ncbi:hypothetical protein BU25DRAFT_472139 [Macroventuria anomochaeta]|uniref:Uncharacterized protein n=1 Tax=Macroventuria anomochaeta TaxID=301207 RepID=A0ACB6RYD3_9PLEO|nr:uncharacterized protein BU25DRAFT_472139 [Macroventuria anomochaeta]KAF2626425.1 hypothetical protein BU25DRAFT_472139 [Macroventuria anomochaeta]